MEPNKKFKFQFYSDRVEGRKVLWLPRKEWESFKPLFGKPVKIDIVKTPMANVLKDASGVAAVAVRSSDQIPSIDIYRHDEKDYPYTKNKDSYFVMEDTIGRLDYQQIISKSSTSDSPELREFLRDNVGLVKAEPSTDHWLTELPSSVIYIIRPNNNSRL